MKTVNFENIKKFIENNKLNEDDNTSIYVGYHELIHLGFCEKEKKITIAIEKNEEKKKYEELEEIIFDLNKKEDLSKKIKYLDIGEKNLFELIKIFEEFYEKDIIKWEDNENCFNQFLKNEKLEKNKDNKKKFLDFIDKIEFIDKNCEDLKQMKNRHDIDFMINLREIDYESIKTLNRGLLMNDLIRK